MIMTLAAWREVRRFSTPACDHAASRRPARMGNVRRGTRLTPATIHRPQLTANRSATSPPQLCGSLLTDLQRAGLGRADLLPTDLQRALSLGVQRNNASPPTTWSTLTSTCPTPGRVRLGRSSIGRPTTTSRHHGPARPLRAHSWPAALHPRPVAPAAAHSRRPSLRPAPTKRRLFFLGSAEYIIDT